MTYQEFLEQIRCLCEFYVEPDGCISSRRDDACPINELASELIPDAWKMADVFARGRAIGLCKKDVVKIMNAADGKTRGVVRKELLETLGLSELEGH